MTAPTPKVDLIAHPSTSTNARYISVIDADGDMIADIVSDGVITFNQPVLRGGRTWDLIESVSRSFQEFFDILLDKQYRIHLRDIWMTKLKEDLERRNDRVNDEKTATLLSAVYDINFK